MLLFSRYLYLIVLLVAATLAGGLGCADEEPTGETAAATAVATSTTSDNDNGPLWIVASDPDASVSGFYRSPDDPYVLLAFFEDGQSASSDMESFGMDDFEVDLDKGTLDAGSIGLFYIDEEPGVLTDDQGSSWTRQSSISGADPLDPETEDLVSKANQLIEEQDRLEKINDGRLDRLEELVRLEMNPDLSEEELKKLVDEYWRIMDRELDENSLTGQQKNRLTSIEKRLDDYLDKVLGPTPTTGGNAGVSFKDVAGEYVGPDAGGGPDCVQLDEMGNFDQGYGLATNEDYYTIDSDAMELTTGGSGTWKIAIDFGSITNEEGVIYRRGECPEDIYRAY